MSCNIGIEPVIAIGLTIMGACIFAIIFCYYDADKKENVNSTIFSII